MADEVKEALAQVIAPVEQIIAPAANELSEKVITTTEAPEFDIDLDQKEELAPGSKVKFTKDRFKELDDDISDDDHEFDEPVAKMLDKVFNRAKEYKEKATNYKAVAEANQTINNDDLIKTWARVHDLDDEKLLLEVEKAKYEKAGYNEDEAMIKATEDVNELRDESERLFTKKAKDIRLDLRSAINSRSQDIQSNIQKSAKALSLSNAPNPELISKTIEHLSKMDNFLGLKIGGKNEQSKKDFVKPIADAIKDGSLLKEIQSNPELLAEVGMYLKNKDKFTKAISNRTPTKTEVLKKLSTAPHSSGVAALLNKENVGKIDGLKDPGGFR